MEQNREPRHFIRLFKGALVVRSGGAASGFRKVSGDGGEEPAEPASAAQLFHVKGTDTDAHAVEVSVPVK